MDSAQGGLGDEAEGPEQGALGSFQLHPSGSEVTKGREAPFRDRRTAHRQPTNRPRALGHSSEDVLEKGPESHWRGGEGRA